VRMIFACWSIVVRQHASECMKKNNETLEWITEWHLDTQNYCWQQMVGTTMPHLNFLESTYLLLEPSLMQSIPDGTAFPDLCFHITIFMS
jgi:hypothetical protein